MLTLEQRLDFVGDDWNTKDAGLEVGAKVVGEVVGVHQFTDTFAEVEGETYPVVDLCTDDRTVTGVRVYCSGTVLYNEITNLDPQPGDRIGIKYKGTAVSKGGAEFEDFMVYLERPRSTGNARPITRRTRNRTTPATATKGGDFDEPMPENE